jgi:hypothetical protein
MRRLVQSLLAAVLLASLAAPVAAGGKPERFPAPFPPLDLPEGVYCSFPVNLENLVDQTIGRAYPPNKGGVERLEFTGHVVTRITNTDTGAFVDLNSPAHVTLWLFPDGSFQVTFSGPIFAFYTAEEAAVSTLDQGLWYVRGTGSELYDPEGNLVEAVHHGNFVDLCALLTPA